MIERILQKKCISLSKRYPVITINGPRQSGKTTLARMSFSKKAYTNLEEPDTRKFAIEDPRGFLKNFPNGAIIDEIQRAPTLTSYIQSIVDTSRKNGLFILTGSQQFEISQTISQSLAGRTAIIKLLPFSLKELRVLKKEIPLNRLLLNGCYPRIYDKNINPYSFYQNYFETYIQRDLRQLSQIGSLHTFEKFVRLIASRIGQLVNYNSIANDLGVSQPTIRKWISILEASYIVFLLPPFFKNIGKRLIKTPKIYFYDTGLASYLLGIENPKQLQFHPLRGNLFENFVVTEFLKSRFNNAMSSNLYFFRDRTGNEVDVVIQKADSLIPIEIKLSDTANIFFTRNIHFLNKLFSGKIKNPMVIYTGEKEYTYKNVRFCPWKALTDIKTNSYL